MSTFGKYEFAGGSVIGLGLGANQVLHTAQELANS